MQHILLTGAPGFLGRVFAREVLARDRAVEVWSLVRTAAGRRPADRPELAALSGDPRFHAVAGDLSVPGLALDRGTGALPLPNQFDACFHLAARTEFKERLRAETFLANLDGTRHLLSFLQALQQPGKLYHVSTAYVCGVEAPHAPERLHDSPARFGNAYEESKHAAERLVAESGLDWTILRPSIIVGDSRTGEADSDRMVYGVFRTLWRLREVLRNKYTDAEIADLAAAPFVIRGRAEVKKNLIAVDDVVRLMAEVATRRPPTGTVYHLVNPRSSTVGAGIEAMLAKLGLQCLRLQPDLPGSLRAEERLIERGVGPYRPYMVYEEPVFEQGRLRELLGDEAVETVMPMSDRQLAFLFDRYLRDRLEAPPGTSNAPVDRLSAVQRWGRGCLAYSAVSSRRILALPVEGGRGFVPYALEGRTAAMIGDPVCAVQEQSRAVLAFLVHCRATGVRPVAVQVTRPTADLMAAAGAHCNRMGDEAEIALGDWDHDLSGGRFEKLRRWRASARRQGIAVDESAPSDRHARHIEAVSRAWLDTKLNRRELDVLVRPFPLFEEPGVRKFFAYLDGELVGFVVFDPLYEDGRLVGYYADVERFLGHPHGIHDQILLEAMRTFACEGIRLVSLGLAPLHNLEHDDHPAGSPLTRELLTRIRDEAQPIYNFRGTSRHKAAYEPRWRPTYFCATGEHGTTELLDVFAMIGLLAPEVLTAVHDDTFEMVQE